MWVKPGAMHIAIASKDGIAINQHFGHAKKFWIYAVSAQVIDLVEIREVDNYCLGHHANQSAMAQILETIADCAVVMTAKIGDGPVAKLAAIGVTSIDDYAYLGVLDSLADYQFQVFSPATLNQGAST